MKVYDFRPETMKFMNKHKLHGGGPTWVVLLESVLQKEYPLIMRTIELDEESSAVYVKSKSKKSLMLVKNSVKKLMSDHSYLLKYIEIARKTGRLE